MADAAQGKRRRSYVWGPLSALGLGRGDHRRRRSGVEALAFVRVRSRQSRRVAVTPFLDLVLTWNTGISYGLFPQDRAAGQWALLAFKAAAVVFLWIWLARAPSRLTAAALGLIIGGALGNAIDRLHWPGVMDFVLFHVETAALASAGTCLTSPMWPLLPGSWDSCMNRSRGRRRRDRRKSALIRGIEHQKLAGW
jgi:signal peptidase II